MDEKNMRLPRIGVIKHPKEGDWFEVPGEIEALTGKNPKRLEVVFASDNEDEIYQESYRRHTGKVARCVGSNGTGKELVNVTDTTRVERKCPCDYLDNKQCHLVGSLSVLFPSVSLAGTYTIYTRSYNSRAIIRNALQMLRKLYGKVEGVPVAISRVPITTGKGPQKRTHWIINLSPAGAVPAPEKIADTEIPAENASPAVPDPVPPEPECKTDPLAGPMTQEQAGKINDMMIRKGLTRPADRKEFFQHALGEGEKSCVFASAFITRFEEFFGKWQSSKKRAA